MHQTRAVGVRLPERDLERIELAARFVAGKSRSQYIAEAAAERAARDLKRARSKQDQGRDR